MGLTPILTLLQAVPIPIPIPESPLPPLMVVEIKERGGRGGQKKTPKPHKFCTAAFFRGDLGWIWGGFGVPLRPAAPLMPSWGSPEVVFYPFIPPPNFYRVGGPQ